MAIALLLIGHFVPVNGINFGTLGVNFFFVLSGLLMSRLLFIEQTPIRLFYRRRVSRILPAHIAFIVIVTTSMLATAQNVSIREILAALFFVNNYVAPADGPATAKMPLGHIWSLSVEEHSYIALAIVAVACRRRDASARLGVSLLFAASIMFSIYYSVYSPENLAFTKWLHTEVAAYGIIASAMLVVFNVKSIGRLIGGHFTVPALIIAAVALHWWSVPLVAQRLAGVGCLALAVVGLSSASHWIRSALSWKPLCLLGTWSFSIYLWQQPFYFWGPTLGIPKYLLLLASISLGCLSFFVLEQPVRRYLNSSWAASEPSCKPSARA